MTKVLALIFLLRSVAAFTSSPITFMKVADQSLAMIGGKGWGNDDFLSSLGGSDEEKQEAKEKYDEFKETRESFNKRQQERLESPAGQQYMQDMMSNQKQGMNRNNDSESDGGFFEDMGFGSTSEGGSRFENMTIQANAKKSGRFAAMNQFEQKFASPLDDEGDESE